MSWGALVRILYKRGLNYFVFSFFMPLFSMLKTRTVWILKCISPCGLLSLSAGNPNISSALMCSGTHCHGINLLQALHPFLPQEFQLGLQIRSVFSCKKRLLDEKWHPTFHPIIVNNKETVAVILRQYYRFWWSLMCFMFILNLKNNFLPFLIVWRQHI